MNIIRFKRMVMLGVQKFFDPYYQGFAAQVAFFIILSLVPTVIIIAQILGFFNISLNFFNDFLDTYMSEAMAETLKSLFSTKSSATNLILLLILALWSASRAQFALMRLANYTYSNGRMTGNFWRERARSLWTMILFILALAFVIVILVYGKVLLRIIIGSAADETIISVIWACVKWPLAAVLYFLIVVFEYRVIPMKRMSFRDLYPGALIAAAGMLVVTAFYVIYTKFIANFNLIYGTFSSIVVLMFWFYLISWVLFIGILVNKVMIDTRGIGRPVDLR